MSNTDKTTPMFTNYIVTDGSDSTFQIGEKLSKYVWRYGEWIDSDGEDDETGLNSKEKLYNLRYYNSGVTGWRIEDIDVSEFTVEEIKEYINCYGYELLSTYPHKLKDGDIIYSEEESIQLIAECIFELIG